MKRIVLTILLGVVIALGVAGCESKKNLNMPVELSNEYNEEVFQIKVIIEKINIRKEATLNSDKLGEVSFGDIYTVLDYKTDEKYLWFHIKTSNGIDGFIASELGNPYVEFLNVSDDLDLVPPSLKIINDSISIKTRSELTLDKIMENIEYSDNSTVNITYSVDYDNIINDFSYQLSVVATDANNNSTSGNILLTIVNEKQVSNKKWLTYDEIIELRNTYKNICVNNGGKIVSSYSCEMPHTDNSYWQYFEYGMIVMGTDHNFDGFHGLWCNYNAIDRKPTACYKATDDNQSYNEVDYLMVEDEIKKYEDRFFPEIDIIKEQFEKTGYLESDLVWK